MMYTREAIAAAKLLTLVAGTDAEIDSEDLVPGKGWTPEDFSPKSAK